MSRSRVNSIECWESPIMGVEVLRDSTIFAIAESLLSARVRELRFEIPLWSLLQDKAYFSCCYIIITNLCLHCCLFVDCFLYGILTTGIRVGIDWCTDPNKWYRASRDAVEVDKLEWRCLVFHNSSTYIISLYDFYHLQNSIEKQKNNVMEHIVLLNNENTCSKSV